MGELNIIYLGILLILFLTINVVYKKFPKNQDKLFKILTEDQLNKN